MIHVSITDSKLRFESLKSGKRYAIQCADHPEVFGHPRHLMVDLERARPILTAAMKQEADFALLPPTIELRIVRTVAGGLVDVDYQVAKHFFTYAGAKRVELHAAS
jgi:hypothetical protein